MPASAYWNSVCWSPELGLFCAVASLTMAATSPDGITWTQRTLPVRAAWWSICWSPELGLFCTVVYNNSTIAATSTITPVAGTSTVHFTATTKDGTNLSLSTSDITVTTTV